MEIREEIESYQMVISDLLEDIEDERYLRVAFKLGLLHADLGIFQEKLEESINPVKTEPTSSTEALKGWDQIPLEEHRWGRADAGKHGVKT